MKILRDTEIICENILYANTPIKRLVGLLGRKNFNGIDGLLLSPCSQIHSIGMRFNFDAVYLDSNNMVIALYNNIAKNRILPYKIKAKTILELPVNTISVMKLGLGDVLKIDKE